MVHLFLQAFRAFVAIGESHATRATQSRNARLGRVARPWGGVVEGNGVSNGLAA